MKMYKELIALYIVLITLANGWISTVFLEDKNKQLSEARQEICRTQEKVVDVRNRGNERDRDYV